MAAATLLPLFTYLFLSLFVCGWTDIGGCVVRVFLLASWDRPHQGPTNKTSFGFLFSDITGDKSKRMTKAVEAIKKLMGSPRNYGKERDFC